MNILFYSLAVLSVLTVLTAALPTLRRGLLTRPLLARFREVVPPMSDTEREALDAGGTWWDAELFSGRPDWRRLLELPQARLTAEEEAFLTGPVEQLCRELDDWRITQRDLDLPPAVWDFIRRERFFGLTIPKQYDGLGFSHLAHSQIVMKLASRSITAAVTVMVPNSLGPAELLLRYGTEAQRSRHLPRLARGRDIPCFALTGPEAGSDAASLPDTGVVCRGRFEGEETLGIRLDFNKRYITLGPIATLIGLAFRLRDPQRLLGNDPEPGITLALVPADTPGIEQGARHLPLGIPFFNGPLRGRDVFIPIDLVIGGKGGIGKGWRMLMEALSEGRGISLPALSVGAGKLASRHTGAYARVRRQFGRAIGDFEGVEEPLARIAGRTYQMDAARRVFLDALHAGKRPAVLSAVLKYQLTERYRQIVNDAMDIQGGSGICLGPSNPLGRVYQAIPIAITVEGANILTRSMIVFGQGALRCHPHVRTELDAAEDPDPHVALRRFDKAMTAHIGFLARNLVRTLLLGIARGHGSRVPAGKETAHWYRYLNWMSSAFALSADLAMMTLGGSLKRRERLSARLGDVLGLLYMASAALKRFEDQGRPTDDLPLLRWAMEDHLRGIRQAFVDLWRNLPNRGLARLLRVMTFPTGLPFHGPDDACDRAAARLVQTPESARERLTEGIFVTRDPAFPGGMMEQALETSVAAERIDRILRKAEQLELIGTRRGEQALDEALGNGVLRPDEVALYRRAEHLRAQVIQVDAFTDLELRPDSVAPPLPDSRKSAA